MCFSNNKDVPTGSTVVEFFILGINAIYVVGQSYSNVPGKVGRVPWVKFEGGT